MAMNLSEALKTEACCALESKFIVEPTLDPKSSFDSTLHFQGYRGMSPEKFAAAGAVPAAGSPVFSLAERSAQPQHRLLHRWGEEPRPKLHVAQVEKRIQVKLQLSKLHTLV